jgi:hypothetical protein
MIETPLGFLPRLTAIGWGAYAAVKPNEDSIRLLGAAEAQSESSYLRSVAVTKKPNSFEVHFGVSSASNQV